MAKPLDRCQRGTKAVAHLQSVLHLDDGAVEVGGGELRGDADHLSCCLSARRCDGFHLLLQDVAGVEPPSALRKEASLLVQNEFWLGFSTRLVVDFHLHLHVFALGAKDIGCYSGQGAPILNICCWTSSDVTLFFAASAFLKCFFFSYHQIRTHLI